MRKPHAEYDDLWDTPIGDHPPLPAAPFSATADGSQTSALTATAADAVTGVPGALNRPLAA